MNCNFMRKSLEHHGFDPDSLPGPAHDDAARLATVRPWRDLWAAGQGIGLIDDVPSVAELVERLQRDYRQT